MTTDRIKKHWKYIKALKKGKRVECYNEILKGWIVPYSFNFPESGVYRIVEKEEPKKHVHQDLIDAYNNGADIEFLATPGNFWLPATDPLWCSFTKYRIKPKPEYIPFDFSDAEQLIGKTVKSKSHGNIAIINRINSTSVDVFSNIPYITLFNDFTFLDGTPCGKLKE